MIKQLKGLNMGAEAFLTTARGKSAREAFKIAQEDAMYERGYEGYTGTIAEKHGFKMVNVPKGVDPIEYAEELLDEDHQLVADKYGPACCIQLSEDRYLFFGYASS